MLHIIKRRKRVKEIMWSLATLVVGIITVFIVEVTLIIIEGEIAKTNRLKLLKHTVSRCERAHTDGKSEYSFAYNGITQLTERDFLYMNEFLWSQYPALLLIPDKLDRSRIYWKEPKM